jgi:hypothetical protein
MDPKIEAAIRQAADEEGIDPATAMAYAQRESNFNPRARASKSMFGLYSMSGPLRAQYGMGDSDDPYIQSKAAMRLIRDTRDQMSARMGRDVTDAEAYAGHHFGAGRAAKMFGMDTNTPVSSVFNGEELAQNPHIGRAGTVGRLLHDTTSDMDFRRSNFGGGDNDADFSKDAEEAPPMDFSQFATAADTSSQPAKASTASPLDFSNQGTAPT